MEDYGKLTVAQLRALVRERGLKGSLVLGLSKVELINYLLTGKLELQSKGESVELKQKNKQPETNNVDLADVIAKAVSGKVNAGIDKKEVEKIIDNRFAELSKDFTPSVKTIKVELPNGKAKDLGLQHKIFDKVLKIASQRINISLVGAAGSGKTTLVENIAKALDLDFYTLSVGLQTTKTDLIGYLDATGKYNKTALRCAFEFGGVFLLDELDAGNAGVLTLINSMTSNGVASFPDRMVKKHEDFILIAASNTYGRGSDRLYVGRNQLDAATLDRFIVLNMDYDEDLELAISPNKTWAKYVQGLRKSAFELKERIIISPRASINGGKLLSIGISKEEVEEIVIWKGVSSDIKNKIINNAKKRGYL